MFDIDTCNLIAKENQHQKELEAEEHNRIMRMTPGSRKQIAWNELYPKLPVDNLSYMVY